MSKIRLRFAPSPTGDVHVGSIWLAQFNWLFARQQDGKFIVRIEDTDQKRLVPGSVEKIYQALEWYGLTPDEGPEHGGEHGPYVQSERLKLYHKYVHQLIKQGSAYYCFCTPERLEELRTNQQAQKLPPRYDKLCSSITVDDASQRVAAGDRAVVRLNVPTTGTVTLDDVIRGKVTFSYDQIDDSILLKSDGFPTYHLAVVVDDHLMEISHVLRAEEWLPSTPKHLLLYHAFGWVPPVFAHLPQILGTNKKKLSKREGAASALHFRDQGYLPEAMQNFLALMGWHPKGDQEVLTRTEILEQFKLEAINPSGAIFDQTKLDWMNGVYIRALALPDLFERLRPFWHVPDDGWAPEQLLAALGLVHDRLVKLSDIDEAINFVFPSAWNAERTNVDEQMIIPKKGSMDIARNNLRILVGWLTAYTGQWTAVDLKAEIIKAIADAGLKNGDVLWPARIALSLRSASPDVFDLLAVIGYEESIRRMKTFCAA